MSKKLVYGFASGKADGNTDMKDLLGGKGANLAEMTSMGIPVPPGFTISTRACNLYFELGHKLPSGLDAEVGKAMRVLERVRGKKFGDNKDPLLVSVRSGAKFSMPGMMDTILNLGLNDKAVEGLATSSGDRRFAFDSYRRFIQMYGDVVLEISKHRFEELLEAMKKKRGVAIDTDLTAADLEKLVAQYKALVKKASGKPFPQDPEKQLWGSIMAVFRSWDNERARIYRQQYGIADSLGTAVNVQCMVFGNLGEGCATGVAFTRNPATGENLLYGEYLMNAQGEDVVAGIRTPGPISKAQSVGDGSDSLEAAMPECYKQLLDIRRRLERCYRDMQDIEFTIEKGVLYMLQTRTGKRTGLAATRIAFDLYDERRIRRNEVVDRIEPDMLTQLLAPIFDPKDKERAKKAGRRFGKGLPAGPGAASGVVAFSAEKAAEFAATKTSAILVRRETSPEDLAGMVASQGILTSRGGMTSHAAVVARGMGKPCIVGAEEIVINEKAGWMKSGGRTIKQGDMISIDGTSGEVFVGDLHPHPSEIQQVLVEKSMKPAKAPVYQMFARLMKWADRIRTLTVRTNADTPNDSSLARAFGAEGIGLCRTEHMFFGDARIGAVREMILANDLKTRKKALAKLLPMQRRDFEGIFKAMDGLPVNIRLLDPPLHEFLPNREDQFKVLAKEMGVKVATLKQKAEQLSEVNPMLGHRGCRLGITYPEIYEMQARAIMEAAVRAQKKGIRVFPEIMIPLIGTVQEYVILRDRVREVAVAVLAKAGVKVKYQIGTMMEIPRACLTAADVAAEAEFFSFGTNDLTQMTYGYSRDDIGKFLPEYLDRRILPVDPFESIDATGVGQLVEMGVKGGRSARPNLKVGVCGEHGGDPASVAFFHATGLNYVSCSPYRVPVARLAAAQAVLAEKGGTGSGTA
ncbi:MAG: pyruvate, phosphate dikinase [Acidobacteria bacterium]|uniref:Pyruvate, phosphate dikinase n=1 Tax=Candidatus Polarisedimenticola svalbardensis TaxID=2886004 RepID=A0A8J6XZX5_9BACT|nr:pyruvate, phosphate dikinase [Candidatus Polarisedimenticola svalbardensis]